jgi:hypothetical protein
MLICHDTILCQSERDINFTPNIVRALDFDGAEKDFLHMSPDSVGVYGCEMKALLSLRTARSLSPQLPFTSFNIGLVLMLEGKPGAALLEFNQEPGEWMRLTGQAMAHFAVGQLAQSDTALAELIEKHEKLMLLKLPRYWHIATKLIAPSCGWTRRYNTMIQASSKLTASPFHLKTYIAILVGYKSNSV